MQQRLGFISTQVKNSVHIHCASVGETVAAKPLIRKIARKYPKKNIVITTTTPTGRSEVLKLIKEINHSHAQHYYLPIDWPGACLRFIKKTKPDLSILMETELWPNLLNQLSKNNIPILLANARLSDSSLRKYQKHPKLSKEIFSKVSLVTAQYKSDKENFLKLGVAENQIELVGNMKFELEFSQELKEKQQQLKQEWTTNRPSWIAASIHPGEFDAILTVHKKLLALFPDLLLIAIPRHPEYFETLKQACKNKHLDYVNRSDNTSPNDSHSVLVGDSMGELTLMCGAADLAFVGGSLIERGGHNPLEPAACGLPVIMGMSHYNFSDICKMMKTAKILEIITNQENLFDALKALLSDQILLESKSEATKQIFKDNRGAVDKIMQSVGIYLHS